MNITETQKKIARYIISGGSAAVITLGTLHICTNIFHIWYLLGSIIGYGAGIVVSFTLQKFWTFKHNSLDRVHREAMMFVTLGLINICINTVLMYFFVDIVHMQNIIAAQIISAGLIAVVSFPIYGKIIFKHREI